MLTKTESSFTIVFILVVIIHLLFSDSSNPTILHYVTKPLILLSLILFFAKNSADLPSKTKLLTLSALSFSLIGDILLMFVNKSPNFFMSGLVAFLIAHIMYLMLFLKMRNKEKNPLLFSAILVIYALGIFYFLSDGLGNMSLPVIVYMSVILFMATTAFLRKGSVPHLSYNLVLFGAILFMISDSLLAINKFYVQFSFADISVISTYAFAQLFIVLGIKKQR
ncbi:lysoplasmalogenase [Yeosuana sp. MJ-SS3]|uniref:Lysoplasmalogenase n=1 Tax=Gilvirhabdus luticola TaxID=3079858 RepID=A0ABU3U7V9_9FLAO|nr:lysoplasmalogenase [Yeosuana sp. MJ-SS3]MDU8886508.1 lysoplasmalogenase [Yeosuana sp. MJ-SS3]